MMAAMWMVARYRTANFPVSAGAKSWCAARGCAVWLADLLGFARVPSVRCWPCFAGCAVFVWALRLRLSAVEAVCDSPEGEAGLSVTTGWQGGARRRPVPAEAAARDHDERGKENSSRQFLRS